MHNINTQQDVEQQKSFFSRLTSYNSSPVKTGLFSGKDWVAFLQKGLHAFPLIP